MQNDKKPGYFDPARSQAECDGAALLVGLGALLTLAGALYLASPALKRRARIASLRAELRDLEGEGV